MLIFVPEWWITDEKDVEDDAARPDVDRFAVRLFLEYFGAQIAGRSGESFKIGLSESAGHTYSNKISTTKKFTYNICIHIIYT